MFLAQTPNPHMWPLVSVIPGAVAVKGRFFKESHGFVSDGDGCDQVLISIDRLYLSPGIHL